LVKFAIFTLGPLAVDKNDLIEALRSCAVQSPEQAEAILTLRGQYPYSQALQVLAARLSKDHNLETHVSDLQKAAVYSCDRAVLKDIMTMTLETKVHVQDEDVPDKNVIEHSPQKVSEITNAIDSVDLADKVLDDLKKLNQLKRDFQMLFTDQSQVSVPAEEVHEPIHLHEGETSEQPKTKREKIIELAKAKNETTEHTVSAPRKRRREPTEIIIDEIKTKSEKEVETERQKEQLEIIDHFIKVQPTITISKEKLQLPVSDLNSIKSGEFGENIVSETLVEILLKQGKKERAIEVLKKLIWKYPQKKAYFASRIEDLKK
jgi:hypothetical protein